ncbi:hypothetical protein SAMN06295905_1340 [Devosia lucknowensis]|uniref:Uncharacterized protein n=1 Tax=Devosia lucknowensis TaxID=1096929 RepID=A0A1Y6EZE5_9HYPH|nr:hypothetical protein SAMN06295905_1340 [Devosia lucknowensis]
MPWVRFKADFDWRPKPGVTIAYLAGMHLLVTTRCSSAAIGADKAEREPKRREGGMEGIRD